MRLGVRSSHQGHIVAPRVLVIFYIHGLANGVQSLQRINGPAGEPGGCQEFPQGQSWLLLVSFDVEGLANGVQSLQSISGAAGEPGGCQEFPQGRVMAPGVFVYHLLRGFRSDLTNGVQSLKRINGTAEISTSQ